ncbi:PhoH family protein [Luminiphilus syltensis NOR5-1B]|uniref:PhoH family protein n=1 Tax=Luminiphilus syltensis NOR5-1B TaxID=565045 RepID=B8KW54_9GAMM|nr:PhoH family protein [Luminiphilus syltensis]EED35389.1 PhoH family protein [Luminiphilus syltensis NOR5-1B]
MESPAVVPVNPPQPAPASNKIYVLDTNVLLHDPMALSAFAEHKVVIPMTVLEELDHIKDRRDKAVSREARIAIQLIDKMVGSAGPHEIQQGVDIPGSTLSGPKGQLAIYADQLIKDEHSEVPFLDGTPDQANDNRIINVALRLQSESPDAFICLVTKDINMRIKAKGSGLRQVEDYRHDRVLDDIDLLATGTDHTEGDFWSRIDDVDTLRDGDVTLHRIPRSALPDAYTNEFVIDEQTFIAFVHHVDDEYVYLAVDSRDNLMNRRFWGLAPRNLEQAMAMKLLDDDDIDMTVLTGPAGSGKTLLALAYGLHAILEQKKYSKLIVARSTPPIAEDIGFLPGTEEEKMAPWLAAFDDNLEILHGGDECSNGSIDYVKERANIQFKSLNFMRGRSFNNAYIIIDEAQGLTQFQLKSIISRVGADSKIVVLGNLAQIDNKYISPLTSGLTYLVEKTKDYPHSGIMFIAGIVRSRLAAFAEENL